MEKQVKRGIRSVCEGHWQNIMQKDVEGDEAENFVIFSNKNDIGIITIDL